MTLPLQLTAAAFFILSALSGGPTTAGGTSISITSSTEILQTPLVVSQPLTLETYVRRYFADAPILAEIAGCESRFRHLGRDGRIIRGALSPSDIGVMQINESYHRARATKLGLDLLTVDGNLSYAKWLYEHEGLTPWLPSEKCWREYEELALEAAPDGYGRSKSLWNVR